MPTDVRRGHCISAFCQPRMSAMVLPVCHIAQRCRSVVTLSLIMTRVFARSTWRCTQRRSCAVADLDAANGPAHRSNVCKDVRMTFSELLPSLGASRVARSLTVQQADSKSMHGPWIVHDNRSAL